MMHVSCHVHICHHDLASLVYSAPHQLISTMRQSDYDNVPRAVTEHLKQALVSYNNMGSVVTGTGKRYATMYH